MIHANQEGPTVRMPRLASQLAFPAADGTLACPVDPSSQTPSTPSMFYSRMQIERLEGITVATFESSKLKEFCSRGIMELQRGGGNHETEPIYAEMTDKNGSRIKVLALQRTSESSKNDIENTEDTSRGVAERSALQCHMYR